jgi:hypothetical protein
MALAQAPGLTIFRDGLDAGEPKWRPGPSTVPFRQEAHAITQQSAHAGAASEYVRIAADEAPRELNPTVYYLYDTPPAPIEDETSASLWVKANRPGLQIHVRAVLPREVDPADGQQPLRVLLPGDKYSLTGGRWQRLEARRLPKLLSDERQRLRAKLGRDINIAGAFVDQVVLNLHVGPGVLETWIDDVEVSPVTAGPDAAAGRTTARSKDAPPIPPPGVKPLGPAPVEFQREQLRVGGQPVLLRGIRHTDTPLRVLKDAGLNTIFFNGTAPAASAEEAIRNGFWLVPELPLSGDSDALAREVQRFAGEDAVIAWHFGDWRTTEQVDAVTQAATLVRSADPNRPVACDVRDGFWAYSRQVDLVGAHRWPLFTSMEMTRYRDWLVQRRNLSRPNTFLWAWVQTQLPDWYVDVVQPNRTAGGYADPVGPHPEQIRVLTYLSLAAGMKGIAYYSDRSLSDAHQGRDRLLQIALLNQELSMLEPLLVSAADPPAWIDTSVPQVKAAMFRGERGVLVIPIWLGDGTQMVPEQGASSKLMVTVPQVPIGTQAWEVTPGEVRSLVVKRVVGGTQVSLPEFDHTAAIVFTADTSPTGLLVRWQDQNRRMAPAAAQWTYDLANVMLNKVEQTQAQLTKLNVGLPDADLLIKSARERLLSSKAAWEAGDYRMAYREAQRAQRPLRVLTRAQWVALIRGLDTPTASPYAASYFSLPQHVPFVRAVTTAAAGASVLPGGGLENGGDQPADWQIIRNSRDEVEMTARLTGDAVEGARSLLLEVRPKVQVTGSAAPPVALDRTFLAAESTAVRLPPGSLVRISFQLKIPQPIQASPDGVVVYDSGAGEALGLRLTAAVPQWRKFTLYRRVPANGEVRLIAALTGLGAVMIDDVRIEPLTGKD